MAKQNKNKISWCDTTINPVMGCEGDCDYCYAEGINRRFKYVEDFHKPEFFPERLRQFEQKTPRAIFINSMSDIGHWNPSVIYWVLSTIVNNPQHRYIGLTKRFDKWCNSLLKLCDDDPNVPSLLEQLPERFFVGETITTQVAADTIVQLGSEWLCGDFINVEPILEPIDLTSRLRGFPCGVIIIGAETGNRVVRVIPKKEWIDDIVIQAENFGVPVYMKESLKELMGKDFKQEQLPWYYSLEKKELSEVEE